MAPTLRNLCLASGAAIAVLTASIWSRSDSRADETRERLTPIYWRQTKFLVPFELQGGAEGLDVGRVELHVSDDHGKNWKLAAQTTPGDAKFLYSAPSEGEYWFDVTTIDRAGKIRGDAAHAPGLKVVIDTTPPRLALDAWRGAAGELFARWQADDAHLDPNSLTFDYQVDGQGSWQPLAVSGVGDQHRESYASESTWWLGAGDGQITLRAKILDRAENQIVAQAVARAGETKPARPAGSSTLGKPATDSVSEKPAPRTIVTTADSPRRAADASSGPSLPRQWPADNSLNLYPTRMHRAADPALASDDRGAAPAAGDWQHRERRGARDESAGSAGDGIAPATRTPAQRTAATIVSSRGDAQRQRDRSPLDFSFVPKGERARMVNSRSFELEYEVEAVGASGIAKVELWGTRDGGQTWNQIAVDDDVRSPLDVTIEQEGIYGFAIVVESGSGVGNPPPKQGDLPEVWVGVDLTPPSAAITGVELSEEGADLTIQWRADDDLLEERPISLSYSERPNGPWKPIAAGLENTGSYRWRLDNRLPEQIHVRLEAIDEAQNMTANIAPRPISLDRQRPSARFRAVRPVGR